MDELDFQRKSSRGLPPRRLPSIERAIAQKKYYVVDLFLKTADSKSLGAIPIHVSADIFLGLWTVDKLLHWKVIHDAQRMLFSRVHLTASNAAQSQSDFSSELEVVMTVFYCQQSTRDHPGTIFHLQHLSLFLKPWQKWQRNLLGMLAPPYGGGIGDEEGL